MRRRGLSMTKEASFKKVGRRRARTTGQRHDGEPWVARAFPPARPRASISVTVLSAQVPDSLAWDDRYSPGVTGVGLVMIATPRGLSPVVSARGGFDVRRRVIVAPRGFAPVDRLVRRRPDRAGVLPAGRVIEFSMRGRCSSRWVGRAAAPQALTQSARETATTRHERRQVWPRRSFAPRASRFLWAACSSSA